MVVHCFCLSFPRFLPGIHHDKTGNRTVSALLGASTGANGSGMLLTPNVKALYDQGCRETIQDFPEGRYGAILITCERRG